MSNGSGLSAGRPSRAKSEPPQTLSGLLGVDEPVRRVNFDVPESKHRWLKAYAAREDVSITELLTRHIDELMARDR